MRPTIRTTFARLLAIAAALFFGSVSPLIAQSSTEEETLQLDPFSRAATRAQLRDLLQTLQEQALQTKDSDTQQRLRMDIQAVALRLQEGDIWQGDVISLAVAGETTWTDDFTITPNRTLVLEEIDPIPMRNVLYSELESHLTQRLAKYLREPRVHAEALKRIAVLGGVGNPGFFSVSGSIIVSDLIMQAGGPSAGAKLNDVEFKRLGKRIGFDTGPIAYQAYSLDQLGIRSGDELHIPASSPGGRSFWVDFRMIALGISGMLLLATRIF